MAICFINKRCFTKKKKVDNVVDNIEDYYPFLDWKTWHTIVVEAKDVNNKREEVKIL
jgi:hypothetical protein